MTLETGSVLLVHGNVLHEPILQKIQEFKRIPCRIVLPVFTDFNQLRPQYPVCRLMPYGALITKLIKIMFFGLKMIIHIFRDPFENFLKNGCFFLFGNRRIQLVHNTHERLMLSINDLYPDIVFILPFKRFHIGLL